MYPPPQMHPDYNASHSLSANNINPMMNPYAFNLEEHKKMIEKMNTTNNNTKNKEKKKKKKNRSRSSSSSRSRSRSSSSRSRSKSSSKSHNEKNISI